MKTGYLLLLLFMLPAATFAQANRKGLYGSIAAGYGSYTLNLYAYHNGSDLYADQDFSGFVLALGIEQKSIWQKNRLVLDLGGELTGGFGIKTTTKATGNVSGESKGGFALGAGALLKAGYLFPSNGSTITPLAGLGPYFLYLKPGGNDTNGNYLYGLQGYVGVDIQLASLVLTPQIRFGVASWGSSDEMSQNGQPRLFEAGLKLATKL